MESRTTVISNYVILLRIYLLFSEMYQREKSKALAVKTFQENQSRYHSIAATLVAKDLEL